MASERVQRRIERLLDHAEEAADSSNWQQVRDLAQNVLTFEPDNADALAFLDAANRGLGESPDSSSLPAIETTAIKPPPTPSAATAPEAERRQLTVMFCDLQGSTALSQQLDPEVLRDVIRNYQEVCAGPVGRFDGHIAKYLGDGLLIYFGYPQAHEDDPQRAVRAGLAILEDMVQLNTRLKADKDLELTVRIGVHTGLVVAGEMGGGDTVEELAIVGETPNIAARLQEAAEPNSVVISDITANLVQGYFLCEALGFQNFKGISKPMELFKVIEESGAQTRFDVAAGSWLTPLVGREQEVGLLMDRWEQVEEGLGQVVLVSGEAGIGKSRILEAFNEHLAGRPHIRQEYRCSPYHQNSVLHPMIEFLEGWLRFRREDTPEERLLKLEGGLSDFSLQASEAVPLMAGLLSVPVGDEYPQLNLSPQRQRQKTMELLAQIVMESASKQPVLAVFEDLHWADPTTLEFLGILVDQAPTEKVLAMFTFRPEFTPLWGSRGHLTQITLNRLPRRLAIDMMVRIAGGKEVPEEVVAQIATKSDGVPLFVEELTRMVIESGLLREADGRYELSGQLTALAIPSSLQDSLTARLDRLSSGRESVQLAAVLGREFNYELIQAVSPLDDSVLARHLEHLVSSEFLYQRGVLPESSYIFKNALIQDAAYNSLLISRRQQYHQQVAQALEDRFPETVETQPELVAHHYTEAGLTQQAVSYWQQAGERALTAYAHEEALGHFQRGLSAKNVPTTGSQPAPDAESAELLFGLGRTQSVMSGHWMDRMIAAIINLKRAFEYYRQAGQVERALAVAEYPIRPGAGLQVGLRSLVEPAVELAPPESPEAARLLSIYGRVLGFEEAQYESAQEAFSRALAIAKRHGDAALEMEVLANEANVHLFGNQPEEARRTSLLALELSQKNNQPRTELTARYIATLSLLSLGNLEDACRHAEAMLPLAEMLHDDFWIALSCWMGESTCSVRGDWQASCSFSDRAMAAGPGSPAIATRTLLEYELGRFDNGTQFLEQILNNASQSPPWPLIIYASVAYCIAVIARITGVPDRFELAEESADKILSSPNANASYRLTALIGLAIIAVIKDDVPGCRTLYAELQLNERRMLFATSNERVLGLLAHTTGNLDQAVAHFEDALTFCRNAGYRPELAWTCCDYADMFLERNDEGDRVKANALLDESLAISSELGMRPLMERVLSRREILGA